MGRLLFLVVLMVSMVKSQAQDINFGQFQNVPMTVNPALTGVMKGDFRFTTNFRRQWNSIPNTKAWEQSYFSFDARKCFVSDFFAYGIQLQADQMGPLGLSNLEATVNFAYHRQISKEVYLSAGGSGGVVHYRLDKSAMTFDTQFGLEGFDPNMPSYEDFDVDNRTVLDISAGLLFFNAKSGWTAGFGLDHVNQPTYSFFGKEKNRLGVGLTLHGSVTLGLGPANKKNELIIRGLYHRQSTLNNSRQWYSIVGATWKHSFKSINNGTAFRLGLSSRVGGHISNSFTAFDALIPTVQLDYHGWTLGFSYDVNISSAVKETNLRGGMEISLIWEFTGKKGKCVICPNF